METPPIDPPDPPPPGEACEYLLRQNGDVNSTLNDFSTPFMLAVEEVLTVDWDFAEDFLQIIYDYLM